jgi:hypothetical protein
MRNRRDLNEIRRKMFLKSIDKHCRKKTKKPHRNAAFVKNHSGSVTPKENELNIFY